MVVDDTCEIRVQIKNIHILGAEVINDAVGLGSCGEFHSCCVSAKKADQISKEDFKEMGPLPYKAENAFLKLIESLQEKQTEGQREDNLQSR